MGADETMTDRDAARQLVERYLDGLNAGDPDAVAGCVSEDFLNEHTATLGTNVRGREAYRQRLGGFLGSFADLHYEAEAVIVDGSRVAVPYSFSGRYLGSGGEYPEGRPFSIRGIFSIRIKGGELAHRVDYWDSAEFMRQIEAGAGD